MEIRTVGRADATLPQTHRTSAVRVSTLPTSLLTQRPPRSARQATRLTGRSAYFSAYFQQVASILKHTVYTARTCLVVTAILCVYVVVLVIIIVLCQTPPKTQTDRRTDKETRTRTNNVHHDRRRHTVSTSLRLVYPLQKTRLCPFVRLLDGV